MTSDPNAALQELRELVASEQASGDGSYASIICERFAALDHHLCQGGALPDEWRKRSTG